MSNSKALNGSFSLPKGCFSQISNEVLRDQGLSLKAKGLYSLIFSYITLPNFTLYKDFLKRQCCEGRHSFDSAWKELVGAGYLSHTRVRAEDGTFCYFYELSMPKKTDSVSKLKERADVLSDDLLKAEQATDNIERSNLSELNGVGCVVEDPPAENRSPVSIYNNTIHKNTKSISLELIDAVKEQVEFDYFMDEVGLTDSQKVVVGVLVEYIAEMKDVGSFAGGIDEFVNSCFISEFLEHIKQVETKNVRYPLPYWRKVFANYIKESALMVANL